MFSQAKYVRENRCPNFGGLFTTKVTKSHVKLHVKSDAQKVNSAFFRVQGTRLLNTVKKVAHVSDCILARVPHMTPRI